MKKQDLIWGIIALLDAAAVFISAITFIITIFFVIWAPTPFVEKLLCTSAISLLLSLLFAAVITTLN